MLTPSLMRNTYLNSEETCRHPLFKKLLNGTSEFNSSSSYFILTHCSVIGEDFPEDVIPFLQAKLAKIEQGYRNRRFIYKLNGWRIIFTFYPKRTVVSECYALKNKMITLKY
ncbi:MAG: hypothetical protein GX905_04305 [Bacteroidales bacterium]|nr:hypothetical protein [Bacteroidales bacterium]